MKKCSKCLSEKLETAFYSRPDSVDGLLGRCKDCVKESVSGNRADKIEYYLDYDRNRANLPHRVAARKQYAALNPNASNESKKEWEERNPEKKRASVTVNNAVRDGRLFKSTCQVCGAEKVEAHHEDYSKPLEVVWLCKPHHVEADRKRRQREMAAAA